MEGAFFLSNLVWILHLFLVGFIVIVPLSHLQNNEHSIKVEILILHCMTCFLILLHWFYQNNICFLTVVEKQLRGVDISESFIHSLVSPVYDYSQNHETRILSVVLFLFMVSSFFQIIKKRSELKKYVRLIKKSNLYVSKCTDVCTS